MEEKNIIALEIGSSKIKGALAAVDAGGTLSVKAVEEEKLTDSVRYGCVRNIAETAKAIRNVITRLEAHEGGRKVTSVYVSVGGRSLMSQPVDIERRLPGEMEITAELINDMISEALNQHLHERTVVTVEPGEIRVDNAAATKPVGMFGSQVSARLNLVSCRSQLIRNLNLVLEERLHLNVNEVFVRQLAEADLVLFPDEKRQGCMLVDFGAETTTVSIYKNGILVYLSSIPMGSRNITRDITALNFLEERAEELKISGGNALVTPDSMTMAAASASGIDFGQINNYVAARAGEIVANINEQIKYAGLTAENLPAGIILIGKGAKLNGFDRRLANMTGMKVRIGIPGNRIRILDGRVNGADHVDVIAILASAAKSRKVCDCLSRPETPATFDNKAESAYATAHQPQPAPTPKPANPYVSQAGDITNATGTDADSKNNKNENEAATARQQRETGFLKRALKDFKERMADLLTEPVEDDGADDN